MAKLDKMQQAPAERGQAGADASAPETITVRFLRDKETKNTVRYLEIGEEFDHKVGAIYVKKSTLRDMRDGTGAWPGGLVVTIRPVSAGSAK